MDTAIIIQARMSSRRFPGKVLFEVKKKPLLGYIIESLTKCNNSFKIIVATSNHKSDNSIVEYCKSKDIKKAIENAQDCATVVVQQAGVTTI